MIRRDFLLFLMITLGALVSGISQESGGQILQGYLLEAAENNPGLNAKFKDYMAAMEKVPQAGGLPDPQFAFGYFIQPWWRPGSAPRAFPGSDLWGRERMPPVNWLYPNTHCSRMPNPTCSSKSRLLFINTIS